MIEKELRPGKPFYINLSNKTYGCYQCGTSVPLPDDFEISEKDIHHKFIDKFKSNHKECVTKWKGK